MVIGTSCLKWDMAIQQLRLEMLKCYSHVTLECRVAVSRLVTVSNVGTWMGMVNKCCWSEGCKH